MNDILLGNNNKGILKRLAKADLKAHKLKTFLSGIVIIIATCLMALVSTVLINDAMEQANSTPYHAMYRAVDNERKDIFLSDPDFEKAGIYKYFGGTVDDSGRTDIAYMDAVTMDFLGYKLISGDCPVNTNEVMVSASYLKRHGLTSSPGDSFTFSYTDTLTNQQRHQQFTICGIIENQKQEQANQFYILTSDSFRHEIAKQADTIATSSFSTQTPESVDVLVRLDEEKGEISADKQKEYLKAKGLNLGVKSYDIILNNMYIEGIVLDTAVIVAIAIFALFLMFSSSFVIYSIFYISVVNSVQMYAQMMSLGTTEKQLKGFLKTQGNILARRYIPIGMLLSLMISILISSTEWIAYDVLITAFSGFLIFGVTKMALRKPANILTSISPVEAMKYADTTVIKKRKDLKRITPTSLAKNNLSLNRKKNRMSVISLSISGTLMIAITILIGSIDLPSMLLQSYPLNEDFQIGIQMDNFYERFPQIIQNNPLSDELIDEISSIPGVEKIVKDECVIGTILEPKIAYSNSDEGTELLNSLSTELLSNISEVVSGSVNYNDVGVNGIIINKYRVDRSDYNYNEIKTGDIMRFQFNVNGDMIEKEFMVIGIAYFPSTGLFYTTPDVINAISPFDNASHISIFCDANSKEAVKSELLSIIGRNPNLKLKVYEDEYAAVNGAISVTMRSVYGICIFIILFGVLNMINMLINSAIIRKREFALLQAVGMTSTQLRKMLYNEGMNISIKSSVIATILGIGFGMLLCYLANEVMAFKFIMLNISVWPIVSFIVLLVGLQMIVSYLICKTIENTSLTERLGTE